MLAVGHFTFH